MVEPYLHVLFYNLVDWDHISRDGRNIQDVLEVGLFVVVFEWDISEMLNGVSFAILRFDIVGSIELSQLS